MSPLTTFVEEYKSIDGVAHIFGVMLFTDQHPNTKKVLRDEDYWLSFHELTGDRFCVFSVKPRKGRHDFPRMPKGYMGMMVPIWKEPRENKQLLETFEIESTEDLPLLLLFSEVDDSFVKIELEIDDTSVETAYSSIKEQMEFVCDALAQIKEENLSNPEGLYAALSLHNDTRKKWQLVKSGLNIYSLIKGLLP